MRRLEIIPGNYLSRRQICWTNSRKVSFALLLMLFMLLVTAKKEAKRVLFYYLFFLITACYTLFILGYDSLIAFGVWLELLWIFDHNLLGERVTSPKALGQVGDYDCGFFRWLCGFDGWRKPWKLYLEDLSAVFCSIRVTSNYNW